MIYDSFDNLMQYESLVPALKTVSRVLADPAFRAARPGAYDTKDPQVACTVIDYTPTGERELFSVHRETTVVEAFLEGRELIALTWREHGSAATVDRETDEGTLEGDPTAVIYAKRGDLVIFLPGEPYRDGVPAESGGTVRKAVFRLSE